MINSNCAAICGLYCGSCPSFCVDCDGCLSNRAAAGCDICGNGFRDCAGIHKVDRCYECIDFPCERLEKFSKKHIVNGICHHEHVIDNLKYMKQFGIDQWIATQEKAYTCKLCGNRILWYEKECSHCNNKNK